MGRWRAEGVTEGALLRISDKRKNFLTQSRKASPEPVKGAQRSKKKLALLLQCTTLKISSFNMRFR
jgi:hypothetical protein